jgi:predicted ABC-type transport system involved in lysophospholipase L1 biosynthesis ATPase subunit
MTTTAGAESNRVDTRQDHTVEHAIQVSDVVKAYGLSAGEVVAVDHVSLDVAEGEFVAIVGRSGSGKTTLLNMLAGIDRPTSGIVRAAGADLGSLSESGLAAWRGHNVGLVFQFFQLLPTLSVVENVMLPMDFARKIPVGARRDRAQQLLGTVGIGDQADKCRPRCRAASSNAPRSPGRWPMIHPCCWPTSRPATSTPPPPPPCWRCSPT